MRSLDATEPLASGEIGELIVNGPVVTREYVTRREWNSLAKIPDGPDVWHRMGDAGYLDLQDRFWFCGRVAHRVLTADGPMFTIPCEAIFNTHPAVFRSALVGVGKTGGQQPVIIVECWPDKRPRSRAARESFLNELKQLGQTSPLTKSISDFLIHPAMPVDIRHNAKIFREKLAIWATRKLKLSARS
jgi:acyl-CoA synthetase (AMP-forming)/AMP-acid ligase II